jgi:hypothetical protein
VGASLGTSAGAAAAFSAGLAAEAAKEDAKAEGEKVEKQAAAEQKKEAVAEKTAKAAEETKEAKPAKEAKIQLSDDEGEPNNNFFGTTSFWNSQNGYELQRKSDFPEPTEQFVQFIDHIQGPEDLVNLGFETVLQSSAPNYVAEEWMSEQNTHSGDDRAAKEPEPSGEMFLQTGNMISAYSKNLESPEDLELIGLGSQQQWGFLKNIVNIDRFFDSGVHA